MRLLIVEGNTKESCEKRELLGGTPYHKRFMSMLSELAPRSSVELVFPASQSLDLPNTQQLRGFDGVLWTGSGLYINDNSPEVQNQLDFADAVFESGVPFYGSCWGMQIATEVAGGKVLPASKGREFGIAKDIVLTSDGMVSKYFTHRSKTYTALCVHMDEVAELPPNSTILASNDHSVVQALTIRYKNAEFFGVQYHPEFSIEDILFLSDFMKSTLVEEGTFQSIDHIIEFVKEFKLQAKSDASIYDNSIHTSEVKSWLTTLN